jgi:hypothetical protein
MAAATQKIAMAVGTRSIAELTLKPSTAVRNEAMATVPLLECLIYISGKPQCLSLRDDETPSPPPPLNEGH